MRSPEEARVAGPLTPDLLEEHGWVQRGFDWFCPECFVLAVEEEENLDDEEG
jgi:hypothetical protein